MGAIETPVKILSSAESFGYGPSSKLVSIVRSLTKKMGCKVDFLGEGAALNFALQNSLTFSSVHEYDGTYPDSSDYNMVLSVMNPYTILWGWFHRKKCIYVDSLYWFWKFEEENFERLENLIIELTNAESIDAVWALVKDVPGHHMHYIAHRLATISCNQYFNDEIYGKDVFRDKISNIIPINPIVDITYKEEAERDTILISLGGLLSPLNQKKEALAYVNLILRMIEEFVSKASNKYKIILATNPEVAKLIKHVPGGISVASFSQEEMLKTINRSALVLTSAGITTMYECLIYETPFFVLPELHDGHYPNYLRLAGGDKEKIEKLSLVFPNSLISPIINNKPGSNPDDEIRKIQSIIKSLNVTNDSTFRKMKSNIDDMLSLISKPAELRSMANKQKEFVLTNNVKKYDDVIDVIEKTIKENILPVVRKKHLVGVVSSAVEVDDRVLEQEFREKTCKESN